MNDTKAYKLRLTLQLTIVSLRLYYYIIKINSNHRYLLSIDSIQYWAYFMTDMFTKHSVYS